MATLLVAILAITALAVDGAFLFARKTELQNVADAAALGCASARQSDPANCTTGSNPSLFSRLNPKSFTLNATVTVACPQPWQSDCVQVDASGTWSTLFLRLVGQTNINTAAAAIAGRNKPCFFGLNNTGSQSNNNVNLVIGNNENVTINCLMSSRSTSSSSIRRAGNANGTASTHIGILTNGGIDYAAVTISSPSTITYSTDTLVDPYAALAAPAPGASQGNVTINDCISPSEGTYNNLTIRPQKNCAMTMGSGTYFITGQLSLNTDRSGASITGSNIFIYANTSSDPNAVVFEGAWGNVSLSAQTYGPYANILVYAPNRGIVIRGNNSTRTLNGVLYSPNDSVNIGGGSSAITTGNIIADSIEVDTNLMVNDTSRIKLLR